MDRFKIESLCALVEVKNPEVVTLNNLFDVVYSIRNYCGRILDLVVTILHEGNFFVNGLSECRCKLEIGATIPIRVKVIPLKVGFFMLEKIRITDFKTKEIYLMSEHQAFVRVLPPPEFLSPSSSPRARDK